VQKVKTMNQRLRFPVIILNFKTYKEATGASALSLARIAEKIAGETGVEIVVAPQNVDLYRVASSVSIPVFAQHVDPVTPGSSTGHTTVEAVKESGAAGSLVNHSEKRLRLSDIRTCVAKLREAGLTSLVCAGDAVESSAASAMNPDIVAVEPPELIGTGIPVSKAKPEVVSETVERIRRITRDVRILCGAGISGADDVAAALKLGTDGVLLASAYVKSKNPEKLLKEMAEASLGRR